MQSDDFNSVITQALNVAAADSVDGVLERIVRVIFDSIAGTQCTAWWIDKDRNGFSIRFSRGDASQSGTVATAFIPYELVNDMGTLGAEHTTEHPPHPPNTCVQVPILRGSLVARIHYDEQTNGLLAVSKPGNEPWPESDHKFLTSTACAVSAACCNLDHLRKTTQLIEIIHELGAANYDDPVHNIALTSGKVLLGCDRALVRRINLTSGELEFKRSSPKVEQRFAIPWGSGVTGLALQQRKAYRIPDVTAPQWKSVYRPDWKGSRSELAVPILLPHARIRIGTKVAYADKPFGVLNFESPTVAAFSSYDEQLATVMTYHMARVFEKIEFDQKLEKLRKIERALAGVRDWDFIVDRVMTEIKDTLGYEYVSLSTVNLESGVIRCIRVLGLENSAEFSRAAVCDLKGNDIQADIVRTRQTEVPSPDDPRLNGDLSQRFGLRHFVCVFIPVLSPSREEVLGTVSAGYNRRFRPHIYDRDVQILKGFVDFVGTALAPSRQGAMDRASHEMNAPLSAIRNNLSRLQRRRGQMPDNQIDRALEDMATDAEILYYQVQQLEHVWTGQTIMRSSSSLRTEPVLLFRDIIIKTVNQLKPMVRDKGLDPARVTYDPDGVHKIGTVHVDKGKISQVIFNLFVNAVKYAESPATFRIRIGADEEENYYVIRMRDWGIGVPEGWEEKIFNEGSRAPTAVQHQVGGSGLGLAIARQLMKEHGGNVVLKSRAKPTEFDVLIPKRQVEEA